MAQIRAYWRINGYDLKGLNGSMVRVQAVPVQGSASRRKNVSKRRRVGLPPSLNFGSLDFPDRELRFVIRRSNTRADMHGLLRTLVEYLEGNDILYFHAPTREASGRAYLDERLAWFIPESWTAPDPEGSGRLELRISGTILGIPAAYGGTARVPYQGTFEKVAGGWQDDYGDVWPTAPYVEIPEQLSGWPLAVKRSDLSLATPPAVGYRVENQPSSDGPGARNWVTYDLTDYLHPAVTSLGDVGVFQLYSNPTVDWFEWGSAAIGGVGYHSIASFAVGSG